MIPQPLVCDGGSNYLVEAGTIDYRRTLHARLSTGQEQGASKRILHPLHIIRFTAFGLYSHEVRSQY